MQMYVNFSLIRGISIRIILAITLIFVKVIANFLICINNSTAREYCFPEASVSSDIISEDGISLG
jgi:hypothetical protein